MKHPTTMATTPNQLQTLPSPPHFSHLSYPPYQLSTCPFPSQSGHRLVTAGNAYADCKPRQHAAISTNVTTDFFMILLSFALY